MRKLVCILGMLLITCSLVMGQKSMKIDANGNYYIPDKVVDKTTGYYFTDANKERFPLYITAAKKLYYLKANPMTGNIGKHYIKASENTDGFNKPYSIKIVDEHEVLLTNGDNTIKLLFENATVLSDERIVYVDFKSK